MLHQVGIDLEVAHMEGWPGSLELIFKPEYSIKTCDDTFIVKEAVSTH